MEVSTMNGFYGHSITEGKRWDTFKKAWKDTMDERKQEKQNRKEELKNMFSKNKSTTQQKQTTKYSKEEVDTQYKLIKDNFPKIISKLNRDPSLKSAINKEFQDLKNGANKWKDYWDGQDSKEKAEILKNEYNNCKYTPLISKIFEEYDTNGVKSIVFEYCDEGGQEYRILYGGVCPDYIEKEIWNIPGIKKGIVSVSFGDGDEGCCYISIGPYE